MSLRPKVVAEVFTRDRWTCHWCTYPVVFAPALKYLQEDLRRRGGNVPLVYYHFDFARLYAPLLNDLAAVIDHLSTGSRGADDVENLVTACNRCHTLKNNLDEPAWRDLTAELQKLRDLQSRGREMPAEWDGLSTIFLVALREDRSAASSSDLEWFEALTRLSPLPRS